MLNLFDAASLFVIYLFSGLLGQVVVLLSDVVITALEFGANQMQVQNEIFFEHVMELFSAQTVETVLISNLIVVLLYWLAFCRRRETLRDYAGFRTPHMFSVIGALFAGVSLYVLVIGVIQLLALPNDMMEAYNGEMEQFFGGSILPLLITSLIVAPLVEEIVFRGALLRALQKGMNTLLAVLVSSALFAVVHTGPIQMTYAFVLGLLLCLVRVKSGSLWGAVCLHIAFNAANFLPCSDVLAGHMPLVLVVFVCAFMLACVKNKKAGSH